MSTIDQVELAHTRIARYEQIADPGGRNGCIVREVERLTLHNPDAALEIAESRDEISLRINCLATVGHATKNMGPLVEARDLTDGSADLNRKNRTDKLSRIAIFTAGMDNAFAADTARSITWGTVRQECQDHLAVLLTPTIKVAIEDDRTEELEGYHDIVFRALGMSRAFSPGDRLPHSYYFRPPRAKWAVPGKPAELLDPIRHGAHFIETVATNARELRQLLDLIGSTSPYLQIVKRIDPLIEYADSLLE